MADGTEVRYTKIFIDGEWQDAASRKTFATVNPATEETTAEVARGDAADIGRAAAAARVAFEDGRWSGLDAAHRARILWKLAEVIDANVKHLAMLETLDTGKTLFDSGKIEIPFAAELLRYYAGWATKVHGMTSLNKPGALTYTLRQPVGVVGAIVPWNFPMLMAMWKVAPALAAGCTVILKPAELTPLTALELGALAKEAGVPDGVLNVVPGFGNEAGQALVESPEVDKIAFTGSTGVGRKVMKTAAATMKRVSLELGGKSPNIVFADADLKAAVKAALTGIFYNKGEVCAAGSRLLVERKVHDEVVAMLAEKADRYVLGDPREKTTRMGPVVSEKQLDRVLGYIETGKKEGARIAAGGERADVGGKGYYVRPTVFAEVGNEMTIAKEEIFGPVLAVIPFDDEADAVAMANANPYGLAAGIHTRDVGRAHRVAQALQAGTVWVNTYNLYDPDLPFGGFKASGFGRELGANALELYTEVKSVWVNLG